MSPTFKIPSSLAAYWCTVIRGWTVFICLSAEGDGFGRLQGQEDWFKVIPSGFLLFQMVSGHSSTKRACVVYLKGVIATQLSRAKADVFLPYL